MESGLVVALAIKTRARGPMRSLEKVLLHRDIGLDGRVTRKGYRQVTLLAEEAWRGVVDEIDAPLPWYERRSNVLTRNIELQPLIGRTVAIGRAVITVLGELEPCARMHDIHPRLFEALRPRCRGGIFGRIETNGVIHVGDPIAVVE